MPDKARGFGLEGGEAAYALFPFGFAVETVEREIERCKPFTAEFRFRGTTC